VGFRTDCEAFEGETSSRRELTCAALLLLFWMQRKHRKKNVN